MHTWISAFLITCLTALTISGCGSGSDSTTPVASSSSVVVKNASLPTATNAAPYATILGADGGKAPYSWSIVEGSGNLPPGLSLGKDGHISGTPNATGTYTLIFKVSDSSIPALVNQKPLRINVSTLVFAPSTTGAGLWQDHCAWCHFDIGSPNQQHVGGTLAQVKAAIAADTGGMAEFGPSGIFPLTETELAEIVTAMSAPKPYITPTFTTLTLPAATVGVAYSQALSAKDGTPPYTWSTMGGDPLPAGLTLNVNSGVLSGTPTAAGTYNVVFMLQDANPTTMIHQPITVTVNASTPPPDGAALYTSLCATCHGPLATSVKRGRNATQIQSAINGNQGGKQSIPAIKALTPTEVSAIANALQ